MNSFKFILALSLTASVPSVLHAQTTDQRTTIVRTDDLNLDSRAGQDRLAVRVNQAAERVCENGTGSRDLRAQRLTKACIAKAKTQAMLDVRNSTSRQVAMTTGH